MVSHNLIWQISYIYAFFSFLYKSFVTNNNALLVPYMKESVDEIQDLYKSIV